MHPMALRSTEGRSPGSEKEQPVSEQVLGSAKRETKEKNRIMLGNNATLGVSLLNELLFGALLRLVGLHGFSLFCRPITVKRAAVSITFALVKITPTTKDVRSRQRFFCLVPSKLSFGINEWVTGCV